jgi:phospholipase/carboxylesterase
MPALHFLERPARGEPDGLIVLHHGRGSDEHDLFGLADRLDPDHRFHVVSPRAPLELPGMPGYHWYVVQQVGYPDSPTFHAACAALAELHDHLWQTTGLSPQQTILGGFSMGAVMSYSLGLMADRPAVAGLLPFSGFIPVEDNWSPDFNRATKALVSHGTLDPVIPVSFGRDAVSQLQEGGMDVEYQEAAVPHTIDLHHLERAQTWARDTLLHTTTG